MSKWTLDYCANLGRERFATVATKSSGDACKTEAKQFHKAGRYGVFRIFDPHHRCVWAAETKSGGGWRMRWQDGGLRHRATMFDGVEWPKSARKGAG